MDCLLDTHTLLWYFISPEKLTKKVRDITQNTENNVFISSISLWEISLKVSINKLNLKRKNPKDLFTDSVKLGFFFLSLDPETATSYYNFPRYQNKDPFDRMIAWQAICKNITLLSKDKTFDDYKKIGLKREW